jgi:hypothetical protein
MFGLFSTLKIEATCFPETPVDLRYLPKPDTVQSSAIANITFKSALAVVNANYKNCNLF